VPPVHRRRGLSVCGELFVGCGVGGGGGGRRGIVTFLIVELLGP